MKNGNMASVMVMAGLASFSGLALAGVLGWQAGATATTRLAPEPTRIATVNLEKLVEQLAEVKERDAGVKARGLQRQEELDKIKNDLKTIESDVKEMPRDSADRREKIARGLELKQVADTKLRVYQQLINIEKGEILADIYKKICDASARLAEREGYDVVLMDDRVIQIPETGSDGDVNGAIQAKRVLWARDSLDITDRLVTMLNNERNAPSKK
jgi:Skp family chaperone for outer membrane proteins